ncbi:LLM class F420-dependent oxidoreductase [Rhodococcus sp. NPDC059968]|uniref:LLM class F420-dependent oxidoreductase n=1 Tax=Rhodococcus sp. NPDC059968 TaxID=3347017 RepID=UPI00366D8A46
MKLGIGAFVSDDGIRPAVLAKAVEERGFESLLVPEHSHIPVHGKTPFPYGGAIPTYYSHLLDPFVVLATAAAVTKSLVLGTGITLVIQRDVIQLAKEIASVDLVSGGRFILGVAAGWHREQMSNHGVDPRTRGSLMSEQLGALKEIWTNDEAEFHGKFVDFDPIWAWPKPVQTPHPPIYVGGQSASTFRRIKELGNGWIATAAGDLVGAQEQIDLAAQHIPGLPVTVFGADYNDMAILKTYRDANIERVALMLEPASESESLSTLDRMAALIDQIR